MPQAHITDEISQLLAQLAAATGHPAERVIADALAAYQRARLLDAINVGYAALRAEPEAWAAERAERAVWDAALADGRSADDPA